MNSQNANLSMVKKYTGESQWIGSKRLVQNIEWFFLCLSKMGIFFTKMSSKKIKNSSSFNTWCLIYIMVNSNFHLNDYSFQIIIETFDEFAKKLIIFFIINKS
jgi:anaerobic C4-dicarboxylate transporter